MPQGGVLPVVPMWAAPRRPVYEGCRSDIERAVIGKFAVELHHLGMQAPAMPLQLEKLVGRHDAVELALLGGEFVASLRDLWVHTMPLSLQGPCKFTRPRPQG